MRFRATADWGSLKAGQVYSASDLAGCNMGMLVGRGVLVREAPKKSKKTPARPVETADTPEEQ